MRTLLFICVWIMAMTAAAKIKSYGNYHIAAQPTEKELADFKKQTGAVVVDLRDFDELGNCSEPATVAKLDMKYERVMFDKDSAIDSSVIKSIDALVGQAKGKPVLVFCKTANRSSAWLAIHLVETQKKSVEEAISIARTTGLQEPMEKKVREYLAQKTSNTAATP